ncbi:hypothetical protein LIER_23472 [Lithospermum erythrorhizon]|uniref:Uncharacterized protein n=1 Tax=Lithospermum erythrorhizon TaxID=34254 RepID=A0AAV3QYV3_LITER
MLKPQQSFVPSSHHDQVKSSPPLTCMGMTFLILGAMEDGGEMMSCGDGVFKMSSHPVDLSFEHSDSQNYARDTPANQRLVMSRKQRLLRGPLYASWNFARTKDTFLPNAVPLDRMRGKRPIAFNKVKVVKKGILLSGSPAGVAAAQHSSPIAAEPVSLIQRDFPTRSPSLLPVERRPAKKRPSEGTSSQGREKRPQTSPEPEDLRKSDIPPHSFPEYDPLMAPGFFSSEFLEKPYTLPGENKSAMGPPTKATSNPSTL